MSDEIKQALIRHLYAIIEDADIGRVLINGEELDIIAQADRPPMETDKRWGLGSTYQPVRRFALCRI